MAKKSRWQVIYRYICRSSKQPESLARGVGLGLFIGFLPAIGFQVILAFFMAGLFNANRLVAILGTLVTNPFTALPVSAFSVWFGDFMLPQMSIPYSTIKNLDFLMLFESSREILTSYIVGCLALSSLASIAGYGMTKVYLRYR